MNKLEWKIMRIADGSEWLMCGHVSNKKINIRCHFPINWRQMRFVRPSLLPAIHWGDSSWRAHYAFKSTEGGIIKVRVHSAKTERGHEVGELPNRVWRAAAVLACLRWLAASPRSVFANQFVDVDAVAPPPLYNMHQTDVRPRSTLAALFGGICLFDAPLRWHTKSCLAETLKQMRPTGIGRRQATEFFWAYSNLRMLLYTTDNVAWLVCGLMDYV